MYLVDLLNQVLWGYVLVYGLLAVGLYFTIRLGFVQFTHMGEMIRCTLGKDKTDKSGISPFQALTVSLASRIGTGNLAGVAVALHFGGPGAIFWMWVVALIGMATAYSESTLAQLYKTHGPRGNYRGGPAYYIAKGLGMPRFGTVFAVCLIISFGLIFNAAQANSIAEALDTAFEIPKFSSGLFIALAAGFVITGGLKTITKTAALMVPFMALLYVLVVLVICIMHFSEIPAVLYKIIAGAFGWEQAGGGVAGGVLAAMLNGVKRGIFSNEAGMGSAPNIAAAATPVPHHPSSQGFVQALGVFVDTIVVCSATAIMIILSGADQNPDLAGIAMTQAAAGHFMGDFGGIFIAATITLFAFTTIVASYSYAEVGMTYLGLGDIRRLSLLRITVVVILLWGSVESVQMVFNVADAAMGVMAAMNLVAITAMGGVVVKLTRDYVAQRKAGKTPTFRLADHPDLAKGVEKDIWT
jgi:AGCS family alanine or glycine:cation symporter